MIRALEFYSGIGGLHLALQRSVVQGSVVSAFDWDQIACRVYQVNHPHTAVSKTDILNLTASVLASFQADLWLLSPACQPYTVLNPHAKGAADPRAESFLNLIHNVLPELVASGCAPDYLLVENVAGFETSSTRQLLLSTLKSLAYSISEFLLTPMQFGIPNSRLRYYLLAKKSSRAFEFPAAEINQVLRHIPGQGSDWVDPRIEAESDLGSVASIREYLDTQLDSNHQLHAVPDRVLEKWGRLFDIILPSSRRTCCFTRGYTQLVERTGSVLQSNEELDTTAVFDQFIQAQSAGDVDAVKILHPLRLRYFSPSELLRLFHFTTPDADNFLWPADVSMKTKYRLIGNSVNVEVVTQLINLLFR